VALNRQDAKSAKENWARVETNLNDYSLSPLALLVSWRFKAGLLTKVVLRHSRCYTTHMEVRSMTFKTSSFSIFSFVLGIALLAASATAVSAQDDRAADREAIRAHIDSIFQAFIKKDSAALRATHADNWLGYLEGSRTMIKGVDGYMDWNQIDPKSPYGMKSYQMREFDMILC